MSSGTEGKKALALRILHSAILFSVPKVMDFFSISFTEQGVREFSTKALKDNIEYRMKNNVTRLDFVNLLIQLMKNESEDDNKKTQSISESTEGTVMIDETLAQAYVFCFQMEGLDVVIPVLGLHRDLNIYPDPMKFRPEKFNDISTADRDPYAYLPFGEGPRVCIGTRFGLMQTELMLIKILSKYKFTLSPNTPELSKYDRGQFVLTAEGGIELRREPR